MNRKTPQCSRAHWTILSILIPLQGWIFSWSRYLGLSKPKRNLEGSRPTASVHAFLLYQAVFFMLLFHSQNSIKSQCVVLYLLPFYRSENKRFKKKSAFKWISCPCQVLTASVGCIRIRGVGGTDLAGSHEPGVWLDLDKGNNRCQQPFLGALAGAFWLWLLPEPVETTLAESFKTLFNHNQAPYSTKITPFKKCPNLIDRQASNGDRNAGNRHHNQSATLKEQNDLAMIEHLARNFFTRLHPNSFNRGGRHLLRTV